MAARDVLHEESRRGPMHLIGLPRGEFFSLGAVFAPYVKTRTPFAPWTLSAAILTALASWDPIARGAPFDMILLGLAAYELLIGLTRAESAGTEVPAPHRQG